MNRKHIIIFLTSFIIIATLPIVIPSSFLSIDDQPVGHSTLKFNWLKMNQHSFILAFIQTEDGNLIPWGTTDYIPAGIYSDINIEFFPFPRLEKSYLEKKTHLILKIAVDNGDVFFVPELDKVLYMYGKEYSKKIILE